MTVPYTITPVVCSAWLSSQSLLVVRLDHVLRTLPGIRTEDGWKGSKKSLAREYRRVTGTAINPVRLSESLEALERAGLVVSWREFGTLHLRLGFRRSSDCEGGTGSIRKGYASYAENVGKSGGESVEDCGEVGSGGYAESPKRIRPVPETDTPSTPSALGEKRRTTAAEMGAGAPPGAAASSSPQGARARAAGPPPKDNDCDADADDQAQIRLLLEEAGLKNSEGDRCH